MNMKKSSAKIADILTTVLTVVVILIALTALVFRSSILGIRFYGVLTSSMDGGYEQEGDYPPSFKANDLIIIDILSESEKDDLQPGQIICFYMFNEDGDKIINTHRIMQVRKDENGTVLGYYTAGDNNLNYAYGGKKDSVSDFFDVSITTYDPKVSNYDVIGVYKSKLEGVGVVINFFQSKNGFLVFVVVPCFLIMFYCIYLFFKALDNFKKEKYALIEQEKMALYEAKKKDEIEKLLEAEREKIRQELLKEAENKKNGN